MTVILVTYVMPSSLFSAGGWARGWMPCQNDDDFNERI